MAITINDIKKLSPQAKTLLVILIVFIVGYLYYFYFLSDALSKKSQLDKDYQDVQLQIKQKEKIVLQLDKYKAEVEVLKQNYKVALLKLPDQREIPSLFHAVALAGRDAGIEFVLFEPQVAVPRALDQPGAGAPKVSAMLKPSDEKQAGPPKPEAPKQPAAPAKSGDAKNPPAPEPFYEEIPVKVTVTGHFQNIVYFFEKVAKLPRIVNISDISIGDRKNIKGRGYLITASCTVKTYMFVDKKEQTSEKKNEKN